MNMTKRIALLGGLVTTSLVTGITAVSARTDPPPTTDSPADSSIAADGVAVDCDPIRLTWLVRPRPAAHGLSTT
jgi:hypothetical protein